MRGNGTKLENGPNPGRKIFLNRGTLRTAQSTFLNVPHAHKMRMAAQAIWGTWGSSCPETVRLDQGADDLSR